MTLSFRTRLFVVSMVVVGAVLALVMWVGWTSVLSFEVERLDVRLCMEASRVATPSFQDKDPIRLEADLLGKLHLSSVDQLMLFYESTDGDFRFESGRWLHELDIEALNWGKASSYRAPERGEAKDRPPQRDCSLATFRLSGNPWRAARFQLPIGRSFVAADLAATKEELQDAVQGVLKVVIPLALALTTLGAWLLASFTMRPVSRLRIAMKEVTGKALNQRLSNRAEDREFRELIDVYNAMLARLEASFQQASRFSADAAHELKTPLTILQGRIEQAVNQSERRDIQIELIGMLDEVGRLSAITRKLLLLSQADAGQLVLHITRVDLTELLDGLLSDARMLVTGQKMTATIARHLLIDGDALLLRQLFNNLISNTVRYSSPEGLIDVKGHVLPSGIEVFFANESETISPENRRRFFERFYRGDPAHHRKIEGNGLGLSLALEIARAHGGELTLESSALDEVRLRLWLPFRG